LPELQKNPENILITGIDKASSINGPLKPGPWRTDLIMLVRVDLLAKKILPFHTS